MAKKWKKIADNKVRMIWACEVMACDAKDTHGQECEIEPTFYQDNGIPVCECGCDMVYLRTEIKQ